MVDPKNDSEWQKAADSAQFLLLLESSRLYGLVEGGPEVDVESCESILAGAKKRGIRAGV